MKRIFFDTEFTGLHKNTTLVSIGLVSECGKTFYAEFTDYDKAQVTPWVQENVIDKLLLTHHIKPGVISSWEAWPGADFSRTTNALDLAIQMRDAKVIPSIECVGQKPMVKNRLEKWLSQFDLIEMWGDVLSYDWVLFCDLFGTAFDIPKNINYIPFDLATLFKKHKIDPDVNREEFVATSLAKMGCKILEKHNPLWDAFVIRECFNKVNSQPIQ